MHKASWHLIRTSLAGALLGLGAPVGYAFYSYLLLNPEKLGAEAWWSFLLQNQGFLLLYLTVPTVTVFSLFGYYHGMQEGRLELRNCQMEDFLNIAAHDIRSPLNVVAEAVDIVLSGMQGPLNEGQEKFLRMAGGQSTVITELLDELLDIQRMAVGRYRLELVPVDLNDLVRKAMAEMEALFAKKGIQPGFSSGLSQGSKLRIDDFRMRQVLRNLLNNAVRYSPANAKIRVEVHARRRGVEISVFNEGPHIPEDKLLRIFDKFVQASMRDKKLGAGLGLTICKDIVKLHGGKIWAENVLPAGVSFHVVLPERLADKGNGTEYGPAERGGYPLAAGMR
jgi:signal transduction histidine kinase